VCILEEEEEEDKEGLIQRGTGRRRWMARKSEEGKPG
jgi:hypothetical protein